MKILLALAILVYGTSVVAQPTAEAFSGKPDCLVSNEGQKTGASVIWSGGCKDGYAEGTGILQWSYGLWEEDRYEGSLKRGLPDGFGSLQNRDGTLYQGGYRAGKRQGKGIVVSSKGSKLSGMYEAGVLSGPVVYLGANGSRYEGGWNDLGAEGHGVMQYPLGGRYEGPWKNNQREGKGVITYPNGSTRSVEFHADLPLGQPVSPQLESHSLFRQPDLLKWEPWFEIASSAKVPFERSYHELTPEQQRYYKKAYAILQEDDEPPYPANGSAEMARAANAILSKTQEEGDFDANVLIDEQGKPVSVQVLKSPGPKTSETLSKALLLEKYKPAVCGGRPCSMSYRVRFAIHFS